MKEIRLSKKQKEVIGDLQKGWSLATNNEVKGAGVCHITGAHYHITNRVFWNLADKGLIFQNSLENNCYTLTKLGESFPIHQPPTTSKL